MHGVNHTRFEPFPATLAKLPAELISGDNAIPLAADGMKLWQVLLDYVSQYLTVYWDHMQLQTSSSWNRHSS